MSPAHLVAMSTLKLHLSPSTYSAPLDEISTTHPKKMPTISGSTLLTPSSCSYLSSELTTSHNFTHTLSSSHSQALSARPSLASIGSDTSASPFPSPLPTDDETDETEMRTERVRFRPAARALTLFLGQNSKLHTTWGHDRSRPGLRRMPSWGSLSVRRSQSSGTSSLDDESIRDFDAGLSGIAELSEVDTKRDFPPLFSGCKPASNSKSQQSAVQDTTGQFDDATEEVDWLNGRLDNLLSETNDSTTTLGKSTNGRSSRRLVSGFKRLVRPSLSISPPAASLKISQYPTQQKLVSTPITPVHSMHPSLLETQSTLHLDFSGCPEPNTSASQKRPGHPINSESPLQSGSLTPRLESNSSEDGANSPFPLLHSLSQLEGTAPIALPSTVDEKRDQLSATISLSDMLADAPNELTLSDGPGNKVTTYDQDKHFDIFSPRVQQAPILRGLVGSLPPSPLELGGSIGKASFPTPILPRNAPPSPNLPHGSSDMKMGISTFLGSPPVQPVISIPSIRDSYPSPRLSSGYRVSKKSDIPSAWKVNEVNITEGTLPSERKDSSEKSRTSSPPPTVPEQPIYRPRTSYFASRCPPPLLSPTLQDLTARRGSLTMPITHLPIQTPPSLVACPRVLSPPLSFPAARVKFANLTVKSGRVSTRRTSGGAQVSSFGGSMTRLSNGVQAFRLNHDPKGDGDSTQSQVEGTVMGEVNPFFD